MNEKNDIKVSFCCLTYNHEKLINNALEGFVMQKTNFPFEIVIHDDASTDGTLKIIKEYQRKYKDIPFTILTEIENQFSKEEIYPCWTHLYPAARGKYIAECDGDDYWTDPEKIQKQYDFMEAHPECSMCHHDYFIKNMQTGNTTKPHSEPPRSYTAEELIGFDGKGYSIHTSTKFWRNVWLDASDEKKEWIMNFWGDHPINVLMGTYGACGYVPGIKASVYCRQHESSSWTNMSRAEISRKEAEMHKRLYASLLVGDSPDLAKIRKGFVRG